MNADYDLLVVGGGINGAAIARDAAGRGLSVLLVEKGDLAQATSSASTKLIHGGLRYLEYREFRLVREALAERAVMLRTAPHLVRPLRFVLPHAHAIRPWWLVRIGLLLYDLLARGGGLPRSRGVRLGAPLREPTRGFCYWDAWADDARLVVLNARDAADRGATIRTRTRLAAARREGGSWRANLADEPTGATGQVRARAIVNAAGPWISDVLDSLAAGAASRLRLVQGSHIIVPRLFDGDDAWMLQQPDGRIVFAIPYEETFTLIGTTEVPWPDADRPPAITPEETAYLLGAVNRYFSTQIAESDIVAHYAGIRALLDDGAADSKAVTRDYRLVVDRDGAPLISVFGGKITTARALAEEAVNLLAAAGLSCGAPWTKHSPLPGGDIASAELLAAELRERWHWLDPAQALRIARAYGSRAPDLLAAAQPGNAFGGGLLEAEIDWMIAHEWARTAEDVLWRRSKIGLHITAHEAEAIGRHVREKRR